MSADQQLAPDPLDTSHAEVVDPAADEHHRSGPRRRTWTRGRGLLGLLLVGTVTLVGLLAPWLAPYAPNEQIAGANLLPPSPEHWLGTDEVNRDIFSRLLHGIRVDLAVVFVAVPLGAALGSLIGLLTSWWTATDVVAQRFFDVVLAFPSLILAIALSAMLGPGLLTVAVVIVLIELPVFGRLVRGQVRGLRELPFVESAQVVGATPWWVLRRHILPNAVEPLIVQLAVSMSVAVFIEGAMSFLGLGVRPPAPSLGSLIRDGSRAVYDSPSFAIGPLVVVVALVLGLLLISQALAQSRRS